VIIALVCTFALAVFSTIFFAFQSQHIDAQLQSAGMELANARLQIEQVRLPGGTKRPLPLRAVLSVGPSADDSPHVLHLINIGRERLILGVLVDQRPFGGDPGPLLSVPAGDVASIPLRMLSSGDQIEIEGLGGYDPIVLAVR
jgi:hypothetical protein